MISLPGMILAGGLSRRMGENKILLPFGRARLVDHVLARLRRQCEPVFVNSNSPVDGLPVPVIADDLPGFAGPLAGVAAGLAYVRAHLPGTSHLLTAAADTPFFPPTLAARLAEAVTSPGDIVLATGADGRWHPTFALWPLSLEEDLRGWLCDPENRRVRAFINRHPHVTVPFPMLAATPVSIDPFFNINRREDYELALSLLDELE